MNPKEIKPGTRVFYHAKGQPPELGTVMRTNPAWVFVRFGAMENEPRACHRSSLTDANGKAI